MILSCNCIHEYQDLHYGSGKRVHNKCIKDRKIKYRCTVCGQVKADSMPTILANVSGALGAGSGNGELTGAAGVKNSFITEKETMQ